MGCCQGVDTGNRSLAPSRGEISNSVKSTCRSTAKLRGFDQRDGLRRWAEFVWLDLFGGGVVVVWMISAAMVGWGVGWLLVAVGRFFAFGAVCSVRQYTEAGRSIALLEQEEFEIGRYFEF